jgi:hypothetical protein
MRLTKNFRAMSLIATYGHVAAPGAFERAPEASECKLATLMSRILRA